MTKIEKQGSSEALVSEQKRKTAYFSHFALAHLRDMKILKEGGVLGRGNEDWRNIAEHCLVEAVAADVLAEHLGANRALLVHAALLHDWFKRREVEAMKRDGVVKGYEETSQEDERLLKEMGVDPVIIALAHTNVPESSDETFLRSRSLEEKIMHYVDGVTSNTELVTIDERLKVAEQKQRNVEFSESFKARYEGKSLYEVQRMLGQEEQDTFEDALGLERGSLLQFVAQKIQERIDAHR